MTYRTIFMPVLSRDQLERSTISAAALAQGFGGHIKAGFYSLPPAPQVGLAIDGGAALSAVPFMDEIRALNAEAAQAARHHFIALTGAEGLDVEPYGQTIIGRPTTSWREAEVETIARFAIEARSADLCVSGALRDRSDVSTRRAFDVMAETGTPVLVCDEKGMAELPRAVFVAWDGSDEAARALRAALPLLQKAYEVRLVTAGDLPSHAAPADAAQTFLKRHGVTARCQSVPKDPRPWAAVRDVLERDGADLLVMGAYSTPRMAELVFGGFTRSALTDAPCPALIVG